jgi:hypothetical protein
MRHVGELVLLGLAGMLIGAGLSATKRRAPRALIGALYALAFVALVFAIVTLQGPRT